MASNIKDIIGARYKIVRELAEGGFGKVFIAEDLLKFNSKCVVKQLKPFDEKSENGRKARELFEKEAELLSGFEGYSQIPRLLTYLKDDNCIVQEFIEGKNLAEELEHRKFDKKQILKLLSELLPVLKLIHDSGVIHRDIKPDNIIRDKKNGKFVLIDFGIAKQASTLNAYTGNNTPIRSLRSNDFGSKGYQAPDSLSSSSGDLYSLGATCFHLLTGNSPCDLYCNYGEDWIERNWDDLRINIDDELMANILRKLLGQDISTRYQNAEEVLQDIQLIDEVKLKEKVDFLLFLLDSTNERYIKQASSDLAELGADAEEAIPRLISILQHDDYQLHVSASMTLAKIGKKSVPYLANLLEDKRLDIRRRAASTLEEIGADAEEAIPQLIRALDDSDPNGDVRWYTVIAIGKIGAAAKEAIPALIGRLNDSKAGIRSWALYALGRMGHFAKEAETAILKIMPNIEQTDIGNSVYIAAIEALDTIGFNIDEFTITVSENNTIMTAREWVVFLRTETLKSQKEGAGYCRRALSCHTPAQRDLSQFAMRNNIKQEKAKSCEE